MAAAGDKQTRMKRPGTSRLARASATPSLRAHAAAVEDARAAGLFEGGKIEHVSFRAPSALIEAAKREAGVVSTTELGLLALALLAPARSGGHRHAQDQRTPGPRPST